jgi:hypothetical protein
MTHARDHNAPGLGNLSQETQVSCEAGRAAVATLKKTIEQWITIGRAVVRLREHADHLGGRQTFQRLLDREGFGRDDRGNWILGGAAVISRLERVMEKLPEVMAWHQNLKSYEQIAWASPTSIVRHCPALQSTGSKSGGTVTVGVDLKTERDQLAAKVERLEREGGNLFTSATSAREIVTLLFDNLSEPKFAEVIKLGFELQIKQNTLTREAADKIKAAIKAKILAGKA